MSETNKPTPTREPEIRYVPVQFLEGYSPQGSNDEVEIDLMDLLRRIWDGKMTIIKIAAVFAVLGVAYALGTPNTYSTEVKLIPEVSQSANLGRLGGLAAQFGLGGLNAQQGGDLLPPQIYPEILSSTDFLFGLTQKNITFDALNDSITVQEFFNEHQKSNPVIGYTLGLPFKILGLLRSNGDSLEVNQSFQDGYNRLTPKQMGAVRALNASVTFDREQTTGVLTLQVETQSPEVTVQLANFVTESLSNYLIRYRTEKARNNLRFIEQRHAEALDNFRIQQERLAQFLDQNQGTLTASARTVEQSLQSEYNVKFNVYNSLTEQLEQARIKLEEDTPVVNILQQAVYPNQKSGPNRLLILIVTIFFGGIVGITFVLVGPHLKRWTQPENSKTN